LTTSILGPNGLPYADLSGDRAFKTFTKGDIVASLQWIDLQRHDPEYDEDGPVPCMVLHHAHRQMEVGCYVIPQAKAYKYIRTDGMGPTIHFANAVSLAVLELGFARTDKSAITRMIDIIVEHLPDLFAMPGQQPDALEVKRHVHGIEATMKVNGKAVRQEVL